MSILFILFIKRRNGNISSVNIVKSKVKQPTAAKNFNQGSLIFLTHSLFVFSKFLP